MRTIDWVDDAIEIVDQTALPATLVRVRITTVDDLIGAIRRLAVRGAPALGVAGALGVALAARTVAEAHLDAAVEQVAGCRPTAVNLGRGARRAAARIPDGAQAVLAEALLLRDEEIAASAVMAVRGADLVTELCGQRPTLLTHCNTGALAAVTGGTALGVVVELHRRRLLGGVIASETRPLLQGARLTAWELAAARVPFRLAVDSAGPFLMALGQVDGVILGADRICANGDVVNKIGSYAHALGARAAGIPFIVVAPESTIDPRTAAGSGVDIEERDPAEVLSYHGAEVAPRGTPAANPAFDITPHELITAIVTDRRTIRPNRGERP
jgi:S-methyl-5-thioribose-1-phosphate isomerase